jgi:hypothetical protein
MKNIGIILLALISAASYADEDDWCGETTKIPSYEIQFGDVAFSFPKYFEVRVGGKPVYVDRNPSEWVYLAEIGIIYEP